MKNQLLVTVFSLLLSSFAWSGTKDVWEKHINSWEKRDLDGIVNDYSEDSILIVNNRQYIGKNQIKKVFSRLFEIFDHGKNRIDRPIVHNEIVYITWNFTPTNDDEYFGTDTFVIKDNKIKAQTIASKLYEIPRN